MEAKGKKIDAVVIPVGGGGLIAGMSVVFKHLLPCVEVIVSVCELLVSQEFSSMSSCSVCVTRKVHNRTSQTSDQSFV